jgi:hypothetical protein
MASNLIKPARLGNDLFLHGHDVPNGWCNWPASARIVVLVLSLLDHRQMYYPFTLHLQCTCSRSPFQLMYA